MSTEEKSLSYHKHLGDCIARHHLYRMPGSKPHKLTASVELNGMTYEREFDLTYADCNRVMGVAVEWCKSMAKSLNQRKALSAADGPR